MRRILDRGIVRHKPNKPKPRTRYMSKAYKALMEQLQFIMHGRLGEQMAHDLYTAQNHRTGFAAKFLQRTPPTPETLERNAAYEKRYEELQTLRLTVILKYHVAYNRKKLAYKMVPLEEMKSLGFDYVQPTNSEILNNAFKKGWI